MKKLIFLMFLSLFLGACGKGSPSSGSVDDDLCATDPHNPMCIPEDLPEL